MSKFSSLAGTRRILTRMSVVVATILLFAVVTPASAQQNFQTPEEAAKALVDAVRTGTPNAVLTVLGRNGRDIASSGDNVADDEMRQRFLAAYDQQNQIAMDGDSKATLIVGQITACLGDTFKGAIAAAGSVKANVKVSVDVKASASASGSGSAKGGTGSPE